MVIYGEMIGTASKVIGDKIGSKTEASQEMVKETTDNYCENEEVKIDPDPEIGEKESM